MARNMQQYPHLARIHQEINTLFERFQEASTHAGMDIWDPPVDVFVKGDALHIRIDLPGVEKKDFVVSIRGNSLIVRGQKRAGHSLQGTPICFHCMEITHGKFEKTVHLSQPIDARSASAKLKDGILSIRLSLIRDRRGTEIEIPVETE